MDQSVTTGLTATMETQVLSNLIETIDVAEEDVQVAPIGGEKTVGASLAVTPASGTLAADETQQLVASLTDQRSRVVDVARVCNWATANAGVGVVSPHGLVTAVATGGPINITGTSHRSKSDTYALTVS